MVAAVYILHWPDTEVEFLHCETLLYRNYSNDIPEARLVVSRFNIAYRKLRWEERSPCIYDNGMSYIYVWGENDILFLAVTRSNLNAMLSVVFLHQLYQILIRYFDQQTQHQARREEFAEHTLFSRDTIVDNFPLIYELLDECMDFGSIQITDYNILKEYIKMEVNYSALALEYDSDSENDHLSSKAKKHSDKDKMEKKKSQKSEKEITSTRNHAVQRDVVDDSLDGIVNNAILRTQALSISWRPKGIFYAKNEIYIDIIERCEFLYDLESDAAKINEVKGVCMVRSYLSGMPVCKLGLNEKYISQVEHSDTEEEEETVDRPDNLLQTEHDDSNGEEDEVGLLETTPKPQKRRLKVPIQNVQFHQCTDLSTLYKDNLIVFTPPDDEFQLLSYTVEQRRSKQKKPLVMVQPMYRVMQQDNRLRIMCTVTTSFKRRLHCRNLVVRLPIDPILFDLDGNAQDEFRFRAECGEVKYKVDSSEILWSIVDLPGSRHCVRMMAEVTLCPGKFTQDTFKQLLFTLPHALAEESELSGVDELDMYYGVHGAMVSLFNTARKESQNANVRRDVFVNFEIPTLTYSGLRVTYLRVDEEVMKYTCLPWVRYLSSADPNSEGYRFRMGPLCFEIV